MGSGSTGVACVKEGFRFIGIEKESQYIEIAKARISSSVRDDGMHSVVKDVAPDGTTVKKIVKQGTLF